MTHARIALLLAAGPLLVWPLAAQPRSQNPADRVVDYASFKDPPSEYRGQRWFNFNMSNLTEAGIRAGIQEAAKIGAYSGFMLTPDGGSTTSLSEDYMKLFRRRPNTQGVAYLSDEYFRFYGMALDEARRDNFPLSVLYDELQFPSGQAGGLFYSKYSQDASKSLEKVEKDAIGPAKMELAIPIPNGIFVGAVLLNLDTYERIDVSSGKTGNGVACQTAKGNWKLMLFYLDPNTGRGLCDYLDAGAVDKFINLTYQNYYDHFKEYFGSMIRMSFYDEPALHHANGHLWTPGFNQAFQKKYGYSPMKYYPALYYDIGPETAAARNVLYGFRTELYAENYIGRIAAWCAAHGIDMSGHLDQEEPRNPVGVQGDLMKAFKHQQIPGVDDIWYNGRSNVSYKVVTSSAFNWDKPLAMAETYAAYRQPTPHNIYRTAMDQFAMGINLQVGNRSRKDTYTLGPGQQGGDQPGEVGTEMGRYVGRLSYLLRHGRHVADVAVLYPIAALQAAYAIATPVMGARRLGSSTDFYYALEGGIVPPEVDYMDLGEMLFRGLRVDYTYLHPEILAERTVIEHGRLSIDNKENREEFRVLVVPGGTTISVESAKKILEFYQSGGMVIATHMIPYKSAEFGRDKEVEQIMGEVFGVPAHEPMTAEIRALTDDFKTYFAHPNKVGGNAFFLPQPDPNMMSLVLKELDPVRDVDIQQAPMWPVRLGLAYDGALTYIHKVKDGKDIYFFANSQDVPVDTKVVLRGKKSLAVWNPHTGERQQAEATVGEAASQPITTVRLQLAPLTSVFYVQE